MLKLIGALLLAGGAGALGCSAAAQLSRRVAVLRALLGALEGMEREIVAGPDDVVIIEGLHGLNPLLTQLVGEDKVTRIFASVRSRFTDHDRVILTPQDVRLMRRMVRDLNVPVRIETCPIVREEDGLALSSRNVYLTEEERRQAPWIHRGLQLARDMAQKGQTHAKILREAALCTWADHLTLGRLDYLSVVDPVSMEPLDTVDGPALMACAIRMGKARLIDNILLRD